jgi:glucose/arabinose dehydrogenase
MHALLTAFAVLVQVHIATSQSSCTISTSSASYAAPSMAPGYTGRIVASGLTKPRSLLFDSNGNLLVVESGKGISVITLDDAGGSCVGIAKVETIISNKLLNHGLEISEDGKTLYASTSEAAMSWPYDPASANVTGDSKTLITGMDNSGHSTRTLLLSRKAPGVLVVSRGSMDNVDPTAEDVNSGVSQIRSFDVSKGKTPVDYATSGTRLGWGLRNSVGVAEHPISGGVYSVENSADNVDRYVILVSICHRLPTDRRHQ